MVFLVYAFAYYKCVVKYENICLFLAHECVTSPANVYYNDKQNGKLEMKPNRFHKARPIKYITDARQNSGGAA